MKFDVGPGVTSRDMNVSGNVFVAVNNRCNEKVQDTFISEGIALSWNFSFNGIKVMGRFLNTELM